MILTEFCVAKESPRLNQNLLIINGLLSIKTTKIRLWWMAREVVNGVVMIND